MMVIGLTCALVAYSVLASFHASPAVRRTQSSDRDASIALHGRVLCMKQPDAVADAGALVVAWPDSLPTPKHRLTAEEAFESRIPGDQPNLSLCRADNEDRYTLYREQPAPGKGNSSYFSVLAISKNVTRESPTARRRCTEAHDVICGATEAAWRSRKRAAAHPARSQRINPPYLLAS
jgi:hypothetical protein